MFFEIDINGLVPVYEQIIIQIKLAIATGSIRAGERIPSVREQARRLAVNPNTVARAYRELQQEGMVYSNRGTGLAVADDAAALCQQWRLKYFRDRLASVLEDALACQLPSSELTELFQTLLEQKTPHNDHNKGETK
ncbi:MAG: GntR family transcriptional regulator [Planctomycetia bacterium]|nr:GntR family transcriptional regulator [Planctomycetia bacterium]